MNATETISIKIPIKVVVAGQVDDGKSTLIGRLLYETNSFQDGKYEEIKNMSLKRNMPLEWSFMLDAFQIERDQAITIDTTQVILNTSLDRKVVIIDAPGHLEFLKNMIGGATNADAAILLIDVTQGIQEQTRRHAYILNLLGINHIIVVINKMDLVEYSKAMFEKISIEITNYYLNINTTPQAIIPISAKTGEMLTIHSEKMPWYNGPTVLNAINALKDVNDVKEEPLRFPIQDIYKHGDKRILVGRIESGTLQLGEELLISPSNQTAKLIAIEKWKSHSKNEAAKGESIGIVLDKKLFIDRGDIISHLKNPPILTREFYSKIFWLSDKSLEEGNNFKLKLYTREVRCTIKKINYKICIDTLKNIPTNQLQQNELGEVLLQVRDLLPLDEYQNLSKTGRFVLMDDRGIAAGGMISMKELPNLRENTNLIRVRHNITKQAREIQNGHKGGVLWFTGLSGAGKSTLAMGIEHILFSKGYQVYVLDGDNLRLGMNSSLGFSAKDRIEHIRRTGEVAALFMDAGFICITALISPYKSERNKIKEMLPPGCFHEIYIKADLGNCINRDPKGLYKKAKSGEIKEFTGISAPYESPENPELIVDTVNFGIEECILQLEKYIKQHFSLNTEPHKNLNKIFETENI